MNSSPFLLNTFLQFHINRYKEADPTFVECMSKGFFVDALVTTHKDVNEAFCIFEKARGRMRKGASSFTSGKLMINHLHRVLQVEFDLPKIVEGTKSVTKRSILSTMAAVFDPLGLICPISVAAKVLFQELCMEKLG